MIHGFFLMSLEKKIYVGINHIHLRIKTVRAGNEALLIDEVREGAILFIIINSLGES